MSVIIRSARVNEIRKIADTFQEHHFYSPKIDGEAVLKRVLKRFPDLLLVAIKDKRIVGTVYGQADGRIGLIWKLFVLPEYRRQGIGKKLTVEILKRLKKHKCEGVSLLIEKNNTAAQILYQNLGFVVWEDHMLMVLHDLDQFLKS